MSIPKHGQILVLALEILKIIVEVESGLGASDGVIPEGIRAPLVYHLVRSDVIPCAFGHLPAEGILHEAMHIDVLERGLADGDHARHHEQVEPPPDLVLALKDEVCREEE